MRDAIANTYLSKIADSLSEVYRLIKMLKGGDKKKVVVKGGFIEGASGKHGGYKLVRNPDEYSVGEIIELMEGTIAPVACLEADAKECPRADQCKTLSMWTDFYKLERDFFFGKKLSDLCNS